MPCTRERSPIPELPEVETVRRELDPWLTGRTILSAERVDAPAGPKYASLDLAAGQRIGAVERRGKFLVLPLIHPTEGERRHDLIIHLGMTGIVRRDPPEAHLRVKLTLREGPDPILYFEDTRRFGRFLVTPAGQYDDLPTLADMGPEPLSDVFTDGQFYDALQRSRTAIKTYLLSQKPVAGVGNIYADEALWRAKVHPETPAARVSRPKARGLRTAIRDVLASALEQQGTTLRDYRTVNGNVGAYAEQLDVYGHPEEPCPRCGASIRKIELGGRGTHFCPACQRRRR